MWINALKSLRAQTTTLEGRLLDGRIAFRGSATGAAQDALASADAVLALFAARTTPPTVLSLVHPEATPVKARQTLLALAFAELQRYSGQAYQHGPAGLLFITQQIVDARNHFAGVRVGAMRLAEVFKILALPATPARDWRNLIVANPGRALQGGQTLRQLRAIVIDASHPRTLQRLPELLSHPDLSQVPLRVVIGPLHEALLQTGPQRLVWLWDVPAMSQVHRLLTPAAIPAPVWAPRKYWLAGRPELDTAFADAERLLSEATRLGGPGAPVELIDAWAVLSAERALCVPLEQAERAWRNSRVGLRLKDRIDALRRSEPAASGELRHFLAMHWRGIVDALQGAYDLLAAAGVPPKFFTLIDALDQFSERRDLPLRIVTASESEAPLLASRLAEIDADLRTAVDSGTIEVLPQREEGRRVAEGNIRTTLLTAARSSRFRYLDLFTSHEVNVIAYPVESVRDRQRLERSYGRWQAMANGNRSKVALQLRLISSAGAAEVRWNPPVIEVFSDDSTLPTTGAVELPEAALDFAWIAPDEGAAESRVQLTQATGGVVRGGIVIEDVDGGRVTVPIGSYVDVYRPETEKLLHLPAAEVAVGDRLVVLLDDAYDSLFERLCEVANRRRPKINTLHLERWNLAKSRIYQRFGGVRQAIFNQLQDRITVGYPALKDWFGSDRDEEGECIGPREEADFQQVATLSAVYRDAADMSATFRAIHEERVNRRQLGRQLRGAIKNLARGHAFDQALRTAEATNSEVEEVMHALELREVAKVTQLT